MRVNSAGNRTEKFKTVVATCRQQARQIDVQPPGVAGIGAPGSESPGTGNIQNQGE